MRKTTFLSTIAGVALAAACGSGSPTVEAPPPQPNEGELAMQHHKDSVTAANRAAADSVERARQLQLAATARADSVERARLAALAATQDTQLRDELGVMVHFDVAQARLLTEGRTTLDRKVAILNANPAVRLRITGACDERGSNEYNIALGQRRAASVRQYLTEKGIDVARLDQVSWGEESPIDAGNNEAAWARNRRAEFAIVSGNTPLAMK